MYFSKKNSIKSLLTSRENSWGLFIIVLLMTVLIFSPATILAAPQNGQIVTGQAAISQAGKTTNIDQSSQKAAINWQRFSINVDETVNFNQPNAKAVTLNRVIGHEKSVIDGALNANGQVFIVNTAGILFNKNASVKVGGLLASTQDISNQDFINGNYVFSGSNAPGQVINKGAIQAADGGYAVLLGGQVVNEGIIVAKAGTVSLNSAKKVTLNFNGDSLVGVTLNEGALNALVENKDAVYADGGRVILTAKAANNLIDAQVNNKGLIQAKTLEELNGSPAKGTILMEAQGGQVDISGKIDVSAPKGGDGGSIVTKGNKVTLGQEAKASGWSAQGQNGLWEAEQTDGEFLIGSGGLAGGALGKSLNEIDVTLTASGQDSDLTLAQDVLWVTDSALTLKADKDINILAALIATGDNAKLELAYGRGQSGGDYNILSPASFSGTTLNGDNIPVAVKDTSGGKYGEITLTGTGAELTLDGQIYDLIQSMAELEAISGQVGYYALGQSLDGGQYDRAVVARLESGSELTGLGHVIRDLEIITQSGTNKEGVGLFGLAFAGSLIRDLGLLNVHIEVPTGQYVGSLIGQGQANLYKIYSTGSIIGTTAGGLVGLIGAFPYFGGIQPGNAENVFIRSSFTSINMEGRSLGGLVGRGQFVHVYNSHTSGDLTPLYGDTGGLFGYVAEVNIIDSYATGKITSLNPTSIYSPNIGGLIGNLAASTLSQQITNSFTSGNIVGGISLGGLVGLLGSLYGSNFNITNSYATGSVTSKLAESIPPGIYGIGGLIGAGASPINGYDSTLYIDDSFATGNVKFEGTYGNNAGGLVGTLQTKSVLNNVYATGDVSVVNGNGAGGLVGGIGNSIITNAYATGDVSGVRTVGGLIGAGTATLDHVWASGDVTGSYYVGGLMGTSSSGSVITNAYATGSVTNMASAADSYTGGLIGYNTGALSDSYATGAVIGQDGTITGGLVGFNRDDVGATISDSYYNSEANSGLSGVGNSGSPNINNIVGLDNSDIDSQFGDQIQQNDQNAADNIGRNDDAAATNQDSYNEAAANEAIRSGNDNSVNDAITEAESDWQSGQSDRNAATTAPEDVWQSDVQARDNNRQAEINRIEAEAADSIARAEAQRQAELLAQRQAELQAQQLAALQAQLLRDNIATGQLASAGAKKVADDARGNLLKVAAGVSGSGEPERAGEYVTGASLNGLAQDSYKYGVEQMEVEGRSFTTGNSLQNEDQEKEDAETAAEE